MATEVLMPRQGQSVESCIINSWLVNEGDTVTEGQVLCEVETDKATFEVEAPAAGTVLGIFYPADSDVEVLKIIAAIGEPGEDVSAMMPEEGSQQLEAGSQAPAVGISPRARKLAASAGVDAAALGGSGPQGRVIERDVKAAVDGRAPLTPPARDAVAAGQGAAPAAGTGIGGRVRLQDVGVPVEAPADFPGAVEDIPVKGVRKVVAGRMMASLQGTAQLTLNASADAAEIMAYRKQCKAAPEAFGTGGITLNDMVMFATVRTLLDFPELNAHWLDTQIRQFRNVHLGFAVNTERGLMVPVIRFADGMTLRQLSAEAKRLSAACQAGSIDPDELTGATFTVTNLGAAGIESFTPVLNPPEVGILGVCAIQPKPVIADDEVEFVPHMGLSLTFDHRAADGAPAAMFLSALRDKIAAFNLLPAG